MNNNYQQKDHQDALVNTHFLLVTRLARYYRNKYSNALEMADLVSAGEEALVLASRTFDPSLGTPFSAYAAQSIKNAFKKAYKELQPVAFVRFQDESQYNALEEQLWSDYEHELERQDRINKVQDMVSHLNEKEQHLYKLRFVDDTTLQKMGAYFNVSHQAVDHRLHRMYNKLGAMLAPGVLSYLSSA